ncbi:MAG: EthD family reductase [Antricoccus sp.]
MYQVFVLYNQPEDPAAFDKYYTESHVPIASKLPGLKRFTMGHPGPDPKGEKAKYYLVATLEFDDMQAMGAAMGGPEGQAASADMANFAMAGATMLTGDGELVV